jgi:hypothetical protein
MCCSSYMDRFQSPRTHSHSDMIAMLSVFPPFPFLHSLSPQGGMFGGVLRNIRWQ